MKKPKPPAAFEIYRVTHVATGRSYVGCTRKGTSERWKEHLCLAKAGATTFLHRAIAKHGAAEFSVEVIAVSGTQEAMLAEEIRQIALLGTMAPRGFNMTAGGDGLFDPLPEVRERIRGKKLGQTFSEEHKAKIAESMRGRQLSEEHKVALSKSRIGMKFSEAHKASMSQVRRGKKIGPNKKRISDDSRERIRAAALAYNARLREKGLQPGKPKASK